MIAGIDHRETAFGPKAFAETCRFLTGQPPATLAIAPEARVVLDGKVSGLGLDNRAGQLRHQPAAGRRDGRGLRDRRRPPASGSARRCTARRSAPTAAGARSSPTAQRAYEFVIAAPGYATTHI